MIVVLAIIIWLVINYLTWWFTFSSLLCAAAWLFLIMPSLLNIKFADLKIVFKNKKILFLNLFLNFVFLPFLFFFTAKIFFWENIISYSFLLLGLLSGGWLSFAWVNKDWGDIKTAFSLFLLNILIFSIIFIPLNSYLEKLWNYLFFNPQIQSSETWNIFNLEFIPYTVTQTNCFMDQFFSWAMSCFSTTNGWPSPLVALFVLIILPFIISRFILLSDKLTSIIKPYIKIVGQIATFFVVAYIFSLKEVHNIFDINLLYLTKIFIVLAIIYIISFSTSYYIFKYLWQTKERVSLFWLSTTRFITLGLVFSFSFTSNFGLWFMIVFILSYFLQIWLAQIFSNFIQKKE